MSRDAVDRILDQAVLDPDFRSSIDMDPERVLADYDLTEEERSILLSRDLTKSDFIGTLYCTLRFAMINENIVALQPEPDAALRAVLESRAADIVGMSGDRVQPIRELLARLRGSGR